MLFQASKILSDSWKKNFSQQKKQLMSLLSVNKMKMIYHNHLTSFKAIMIFDYFRMDKTSSTNNKIKIFLKTLENCHILKLTLKINKIQIKTNAWIL
jgi:hypothetical protein